MARIGALKAVDENSRSVGRNATKCAPSLKQAAAGGDCEESTWRSVVTFDVDLTREENSKLKCVR